MMTFSSVTPLFNVLISLVSLLISLSAAWFAYKANDINVESGRAWIGVPEIKFCGTTQPEWEFCNPIPNDDDYFTAKLYFTNSGKSPTTIYSIDATYAYDRDWRKETEKLCKDAEEAFDKKPFNGLSFTLIPGDKVFMPLPHVRSISLSGIRRLESDKITPHIVGCVIYGSQASGDKFVTKFVIPLGASDHPERIGAKNRFLFSTN